jgi:hypothetical protein
MIRTATILLTCFLLSASAVAQKLPTRISPALQSKSADYYLDSVSTFTYLVETANVEEIRFPGLKSRHLGWGVHAVSTSPAVLWKFMSSSVPYQFIDEQLRPVTEGGVLNYDMSANRITKAWHQFPGLKGEGQTVSVKENRMDTNDIDLLKRFVPSPAISPVGETHATVMTTLIAGAGNSFYTGRGVASKAKYSSSDFITVLPDTITYYTGLGIRVQNHSYGTGIQNFYGINARAFDLSSAAIPELIHVFSSGNSGNQASGQGVYAGISGLANITGNMKMAKNVLLVGAMDSAGIVPVLSSKGPLYDGRLAPHVVAFGEDGTSGAAALASGVSLLIQQLHASANSNRYPLASLTKAILANSADDIYTPGPDYTSGFGKMNAAAAIQTVMDNRFFAGEIDAASERDFSINVPAGAAELKVTLSWTDPAAAAGASKALLNDIDLKVLAPGGSVTDPWVLSIYPTTDSLLKSAERKRDSLNNIEQVSIEFPAEGSYTIRVLSGILRTPAQAFSIAYQVKLKDQFDWDFPKNNDVLISGNRVLARWSSTISGNGSLEISRNNGPWETLTNNLPLAEGSHPVQLADSAFEMKLRVRAGSASFETGPVLVAPVLQNRFGYVCDTVILNYWNKVKQASAYRLYRINYDSMQPLVLTSDTSAAVPRAGSSYFAVAPIINGREAFRGPAIDYTKQNVGCYINNFLVDLQVDETAKLNLSLGSLYNVKKIEFRKISENNKLIFSQDSPQGTAISFVDNDPHKGLNTYQALVYLNDGTIVYSNLETIYFLNDKAHIVFPNPVTRGTDVSIVSEQPDDETALIYDNQGRLLVNMIITDKVQKLPTSAFPAGMYHLRILSRDKPAVHYSFIVR